MEHDVPYMLAVTPFLESQGARKPLSDASVATLQAVMAEGVDLALHGFAHKSRYRNYGTELLSLPAAALRTGAGKSRRLFDQAPARDDRLRRSIQQLRSADIQRSRGTLSINLRRT